MKFVSSFMLVLFIFAFGLFFIGCVTEKTKPEVSPKNEKGEIELKQDKLDTVFGIIKIQNAAIKNTEVR